MSDYHIFKGRAVIEGDFISDMNVHALMETAIENIKDDLGYMGEFTHIKVTIEKKRKITEEEREEMELI